MSGKNKSIAELIEGVRKKGDFTTKEQLGLIEGMLKGFDWDSAIVAWCKDKESMIISSQRKPEAWELIEVCASLLLALCEDYQQDDDQVSQGVFMATRVYYTMDLYCMAASATSTQQEEWGDRW